MMMMMFVGFILNAEIIFISAVLLDRGGIMHPINATTSTDATIEMRRFKQQLGDLGVLLWLLESVRVMSAVAMYCVLALKKSENL